jgi:cell division protein FtsB
MDSKEQAIITLKRDNDYLKKENEFLKAEFMKLTGTYPSLESGSVYLPPLGMKYDAGGNTNGIGNSTSDEVEKLREENNLLKKTKEIADRQNTNLVNENHILNAKLNNLENVFIGSSIIRNKDGSAMNDMGDDYNMSTVRQNFDSIFF